MEALIIPAVLWVVGSVPALAYYIERYVDTPRYDELLEKHGDYRGNTIVVLRVIGSSAIWPISLGIKYIVGMVKGK